MLCGLVGRFEDHLEHVRDVIGLQAGARGFAAMNALMLEHHTLVPRRHLRQRGAERRALAEIAVMAVDEVRRFGLPPKVAFLSHSHLRRRPTPSALRMREARELFRLLAPDVECDGEMHGDAALSEDDAQAASCPRRRSPARPTCCVLPNLDAANILFNVLKMTGGHGVTVGPILLGAAKPAHILTPSATVRRVVNMTALATADAAALQSVPPTGPTDHR